MEADVLLSESERATLRGLAYRRDDGLLLDWLTVYRLKQRGLVEESYNGPRITPEGKRLLNAHGIAPRGADR